MQRFFASLICLLGVSGCVIPAGFNYTPPAEPEPMYYVPPVIDRNTPQPTQPQQPVIVQQYMPMPHPYYMPMNNGGYGTTSANPYLQQIAQQKMDALSQSYTAHNFNIATAATNIQPVATTNSDTPVPNHILLQHPQTRDMVHCDRTNYPCVYAYENEGYVRIQPVIRPTAQPVQTYPSEPVVAPYNQTIPRW